MLTIASNQPPNEPLTYCTSAALHCFLGGANTPISFGVSPPKGFGLFVVAEEFPIEIFNRDEDAAITSRWILENQISTWLSQEE
jgi:hypothetical protein